MMLKFSQKKFYITCSTVFILLLAGCSFDKKEEHYIFSALPTFAVEENVSATTFPTQVTELPDIIPTIPVTVAPTEAPLPEILSVYEQIAALETSDTSQEGLPVKAALLVNLTDEKVLYSEHATETVYPASITKLMTALIAFSNTEHLSETVEISAKAATPVVSDAKMCGFLAGDRMLFSDLLGCMLIYSGNDTSVAVAEYISGSEEEFVRLMNETAAELGLTKTNFCNSHGLPEYNHVTSAYDIYLIMQKLFNFEEFLGIIESGSITVDVLRGESALKTFTFASTNQFFTGAYQMPEGLTMLGGKTGTTSKAGNCLTVYVTDEIGDCYIAEIFGAESRESLYASMIQLLSHISDE